MADTADKVYHSDLVVDEIRDNPAGRDVKHLDEEYVTFKNSGTEPLLIGEWTVRNDAGDEFRFPERTELKPGERVTLYSGTGSDTDSEFYWGATRPRWRNAGDTVRVEDDAGRLRIREPYNA